MTKSRTYFEQIPLEIVKKITAEEITPEATTERDPKTKMQKTGKDLSGTKKKLSASSRSSSQMELAE